MAHVVAVEPDGALAEYLRATWDQATTIDVVVQPFEEIDLPDASFDLALAATSFHWIDPAVGLTKVRRVLRPGGLWAMFWNVFGDPSRADLFHEATRELLEPLEASPSGRMDLRDSPLNVEPYIQQLADASFEEIETELIPGNARTRRARGFVRSMGRTPRSTGSTSIAATEFSTNWLVSPSRNSTTVS